MKQGTFVNRIVMLLLFAAILLYLGGAAWRELRDPYPTVQAYAYSVEDTVETTGYLVRQEQVLTGAGGIVRLTPAEGEKVAAGATVALLYADELSLERSERLELLQSEVSQLTGAVEAAGESGQGEQRSSQGVADALIKLRASVEKGDFTRLENQVSTFKSAVYQQAQRYGDAGDLSAAIANAQSEIELLKTQTAQSTGRVTVERSGIFSGQVDGYETVLTPEMIGDLTPGDLAALESRDFPVAPDALGRLITSSRWYFVCPVSEADSHRFVAGDRVTVRFSRDWAGEVGMTVESIGGVENGQVAVVFSSNRFLSDTTLLRRQTVELVFDQLGGIRVPKGAVRVEEGQSVVYVQVGVNAERKPVNILAQGEDYTLVEPVVETDASIKQEKLALRAGDAVILASQEIWDGKVLE